ncbi:MAG: dTDP-4-dehydrorhamnose 3,5-epimerase [Chlamydiales bacterium]|nr:dTDP-4-dehydrorhamnose 3,5-epimerase [Chlamydiales bacterium]
MNLQAIPLVLEGPRRIRPRVFHDERGFFWECYREPLYRALGIEESFVQVNHSFSKKGTIRGMHFQRSPGQAKLVTVITGKIFDVVVDIRPDSPTFGKWEGLMLDDEAREQLFIPVGFAHGFCAVSPEAHVLYKVSQIYDPAEERGFRYDDPFVGIEWPEMSPLLSKKDLEAPSFHEALK